MPRQLQQSSTSWQSAAVAHSAAACAGPELPLLTPTEEACEEPPAEDETPAEEAAAEEDTSSEEAPDEELLDVLLLVVLLLEPVLVQASKGA